MKSITFCFLLLSLFQFWNCQTTETKPTVNATSADEMQGIKWIAYSPTNFGPTKNEQPSIASIEQDLMVLASACFTGLVTYGLDGVLGKELPDLAKKTGYKGLILGVWDFKNEEEMTNAKTFADHELVKGFCVVNEGLDTRYSIEELAEAIQEVRSLTGKMVTTTEQIEDYADPKLLALGDWIFPNVHPYWPGKLKARPAIGWTLDAFEDLERRSDKLVLLKEVGFPTTGYKSEVLELVDESIKLFLHLSRLWKRFESFYPFWLNGRY